MRFQKPYHVYKEIVPLEFDARGYYSKSNGVIEYAFNQFGARWIRPEDQKIAGDVTLVFGDSFAYGFGLRYQDSSIYQLENCLRRNGINETLINFSELKADSRRVFEIFNQTKARTSHRKILYALNINDLIEFPTSYVIQKSFFYKRHKIIRWLIQESQLIRFLLGRTLECFWRGVKLKELTSASVFDKPFYDENLEAIIRFHQAALSEGSNFRVVILPVLIDIKQRSFEPVYSRITDDFEKNGIQYYDLTQSVNSHKDSELWILPIDQHPNEITNKLFADSLCEMIVESEKAGSTARES